MNSINVYQCRNINCKKVYTIPCLFVEDAKQKGIETQCPKCKFRSELIHKSLNNNIPEHRELMEKLLK